MSGIVIGWRYRFHPIGEGERYIAENSSLWTTNGMLYFDEQSSAEMETID